MKPLAIVISVSLILLSNLFSSLDTSFSFISNARFVTNIIEAIAFYSNGFSSQYGDLLYIRMLQYYGKRSFNYDDYLGGYYPLMYQKVRDIAIVDPGYVNAVVLGSTILAFGLNETTNAKSVINLAMISPKLTVDKEKYLKLLAAIVTYENNKKNIYDLKTLSLLYNYAMEEGSSDMFRNIVAFLCLKGGRKDLALSLYKEILRTSKDQSYIERALRGLEKIGKL